MRIQTAELPADFRGEPTIAETSPVEDLRAQAVESIGRVGTPNALASLEDIACKNDSERARDMAVESMGRRCPPEQALDKLSRIADTHPNADTRRIALPLLEEILKQQK